MLFSVSCLHDFSFPSRTEIQPWCLLLQTVGTVFALHCCATIDSAQILSIESTMYSRRQARGRTEMIDSTKQSALNHKARHTRTNTHWISILLLSFGLILYLFGFPCSVFLLLSFWFFAILYFVSKLLCCCFFLRALSSYGSEWAYCSDGGCGIWLEWILQFDLARLSASLLNNQPQGQCIIRETFRHSAFSHLLFAWFFSSLSYLIVQLAFCIEWRHCSNSVSLVWFERCMPDLAEWSTRRCGSNKQCECIEEEKGAKQQCQSRLAFSLDFSFCLLHSFSFCVSSFCLLHQMLCFFCFESYRFSFVLFLSCLGFVLSLCMCFFAFYYYLSPWFYTV